MSASLAGTAIWPVEAYGTTSVLSADRSHKFAPDGEVLPFPGNSIICHLAQQGPDSAIFYTLLDFYRIAPRTGFGPKIALLPPSSYHMTVIGGATASRRSADAWPSGVPYDAPIEDCNRIVGHRLQQADLPQACPIRMKVDEQDTGYDENTVRIPLAPVDQAEFDRIERLRSAIAKAIGIPEPAPGTYQFHITLGYVLQPFSRTQEDTALAALSEWKQRVVRAAPIINLGIPEYCTFEDMYAFRRQFFLGIPL